MIDQILSNDFVILAIKLSVLLMLLPLTLVLGWVELKAGAHMQARLGPMYAGGFHGWAQTLADGIKFVLKEDLIPDQADRPVFKMVPFVIMLSAASIFIVVPIGPKAVIEDLDVGLFYLLAASSIGVIGILMAGWSSANKYSLLGALRSAAQLIAYELPIVLSAATIAMLAGSLSLVDIVEAQKSSMFGLPVPYIFVLPVGLIAFVVFLIASTAELTRPPFDMPVAEAELITGAFTEYTGIRFAFSLFASEYIAMIGLAAVGTTLFLGGYLPPVPALGFVPGPIWFVAKLATILFILIWIRWTYPRLREDQLQKFAWKVLIPLSLANIFLAGAMKLTPLI
ncbi:MAG: NADH-quinone oxidoreductase subunit NuoH [Actinomycetota bacterium]